MNRCMGAGMRTFLRGSGKQTIFIDVCDNEDCGQCYVEIAPDGVPMRSYCRTCRIKMRAEQRANRAAQRDYAHRSGNAKRREKRRKTRAA